MPVLMRRTPQGWFADFGRAAFGTVRIIVTASQSATVTVHLGEKLDREGRLDRTPPGSIRYRAAEPILTGPGTHAHQAVVPPDQRNTGPAAIRMPDELFEVLPFRYAEIDTDAEDVRLAGIVRLAVHVPFDEGAARFACSDPRLEKVWDLCRYSIKATSFCGLYVDGDRERIPYEADAYINQLCHYGVDTEYETARRTFEHLVYHPTWPTEWALHFVPMAWADFQYTGRTDLIQAYYGELRHKLLLPLAREDGLICTGRQTPELLDTLHLREPMRDIVDWPPGSFTAGGAGERDGYDMVAVNTVVNAFHYWNLVLFGRMAALLGQADDAAFCAARAARVAESIRRTLFDVRRRLFLDGEGTEHASLHANAFPAAFGLADAAGVRESVLAFLRSRGMACSVYGAQYLLEALYRLGAADDALGLMVAEHDRGWLNMLAAGSTVTLEAWDWRYKNNLDWNHAWGAAPANLIPRFLVGVRPDAPGFDRALVAPAPGGLEAFDATVPTRHGPIRVVLAPPRGGRQSLVVASPVPVRLDLAGLAGRNIVPEIHPG